VIIKHASTPAPAPIPRPPKTGKSPITLPPAEPPDTLPPAPAAPI